MEPSLAISMIETDLRSVVRQHADTPIEETWLRHVLGDLTVEDLKRRRDDEIGKRKPATVPASLLVYTTLIELRKCLAAIDWSLLAPALGKKGEFDHLLNQVDRYRNTVAHNRELLPHEAAFLHGVAGIIRTRVTVHRSAMDVDSQHYPIIEYVRDSFGNEASDLDPSSGLNFAHTKIRLEVGDVVTFSCRGWDAQGRDLTWTAGPFVGAHRASAVGTEVDLSWVVEEQDVGASTQVLIRLNSSGKYHRHGGHDQIVLFAYAVNPPTEPSGAS